MLVEYRGTINADLTVGADVKAAKPLKANEGISADGVKLHGKGFIVTALQAAKLGLGKVAGLENVIKPYRNGRDIQQQSRALMVIDLYGLNEKTVRLRFPDVYQHLLLSVKPERDQNSRASYRDNWWIFGEPRRDLRPAIHNLLRYIATVDTARHRVFSFQDS